VDLHKQVVLIVGATGAVGMSFAKHVLQHGGKVAAVVRRPWQVAGIADSLGRDRVLVGCVGSQDGEAAAGFVKGVKDALGPITAYVCTAGRWSGAPVGKDAAGALQELLEANLLAGANLARAVVGAMRRQRAGTLTFVGSAAVGGAAGAAANYLASKAALHEYVRALAADLAGSGVRAAAVLPPTIDTAANREAMPDADRSRWVTVDRVVETLARHAFGPEVPGGPLYPLAL
jgi:NAD(P)-dependent dehydrogenase (short-subunit alcohol dehydrogenase family)